AGPPKSRCFRLGAAQAAAMKFARGWVALVLGLLLATNLPAQTEPAHPEATGEVTELGQWMDRMNSAFRKLRRQVVLPERNAASRELVGEMLLAAAKARELTPEKIADVSASEH